MAAEAHKRLDKIRSQQPELVGYIDELSFSIKLGPCTLTYGRFYDRAQDVAYVMNELANKPPEFRRSTMIAAIEAAGPDTVDLGISINFAFVAASNELGGGFDIPAIPLGLASELTNIVLRELGVPE